MLWECTPGSFRWRYSFDETIHFLEGSVTITGNDGVTRQFGPGSMVFFPAGSLADWRIHVRVKKLAFCHMPAPWALRLPLKAARRLGKLWCAITGAVNTRSATADQPERRHPAASRRI
jgi:hypothetical protein